MANDMRKQLTKYLTDAHSIEEQALQQLRDAPAAAGDAGFEHALREHLRETENHESRVRNLLEARGASPSKAKDLVMRIGGAGFLLFARSQPDTPGKLAAHALSYEALEWAAYDLLARTADRAGEPEVARVARSIRDEERAMMTRIEECFDGTVEASLRELRPDDLKEQLRKYLADAHAIEAQAIQLLESGVGMVEGSSLEPVFAEHLEQTKTQQERVERRLEALDGERAILKDAALRLGALDWGMFFKAQPDTTGKLGAFAYAFEHLEIGAYEQLRRVADRAGDRETAALAREILEEERRAAGQVAATFDDAVTASLEEQGIGASR